MDNSEQMIKEMMTSIGRIVPDNLLSDIEIRLHTVVRNYKVEPASNEIMGVDMEATMEILKMFLVSKKVEGLTEKTLKYYKLTLLKALQRINKPVDKITTNDIRLYLAYHQSSNANKDNIRRTLSSFFAWCTAEEYIPHNIMLRIKKIKSEKKVRRPFTEIEIEKLREGAESLREKAMIDVLISTGCRISEMAGMNIGDIEGDQLVVKGKGQKERIVYLNAKAIVSLQNYLNTRTDNNPALFVSEQKPHNRLKVSGFEIRLRTLGRELGIDNVHPHRFRRTAATLALNRGMPIEQVQKMLGHEQIETTLIYAQAAQEMVKESHKKYLT